MRTLIYFLMFTLIAMQLIACKKETASPSSLPVTASAIAGNFTVGSFISTGDQTTAFDGYTFSFKENGTIIATKGSDTFSGTWRLDDGNNREIKISFSNSPLNQLNGSWHIEDLTDDHLYLAGDGEQEDNHDDHSDSNSYLEFERD